MPLYKRKVVENLPLPDVQDENADIWVMRRTGEAFVDYEEYLKRWDFYGQKKFTDRIKGYSHLTFWQAMNAEANGSQHVKNRFPVPLREPVLRRVQFQQVGRIDDLVNIVYDEYKQEFFPREHVLILMPNGERRDCTIREKAEFCEIPGVRKAYASYMVDKLPGVIEQDRILRDRREFSKAFIRQFLKDSVTREAWHGAPWLVKDDLARQYRLPTEIPEHLRQENQIVVKKVYNTSAKKAAPHTPNGTTQAVALPVRNGHLPKPLKARKLKQGAATKDGQIPTFSTHPQGPNHTSLPFSELSYEYTMGQTVSKRPPSPTPPPPIKYPIEDLDVSPKDNAKPRPALSFWTPQQPGTMNGDSHPANTLHPDSVGPLLEIWNTLNIHCEVYQLDSFTIDDLSEALEYASESIECELLAEVHCAVLQTLVNEDGHLQVTLPDMPEDEEESSEEEEDEDEEEEDEGVAEPSPPPPARSTRSSLAKAEAVANPDETEEEEEDPGVHRAAELFVENSWHQRLAARSFAQGEWIIILVGLLYQYSLEERNKETCEQLLQILAPLDEDPRLDTIVANYMAMDVNLRVRALEIAVRLSVSAKPVRDYLTTRSEKMTEQRKRKIDAQRERKVLVDQLKELEEERKKLIAEHEEKTAEAQDAASKDKPQEKTADTPKSKGKANDKNAKSKSQPNGVKVKPELAPAAVVEDEDDDEHNDSDATSRRRSGLGSKRKRGGTSPRRAATQAMKRVKTETKESREAAKALALVAKEAAKRERELAKLSASIEGVKEQIRDCETEVALYDTLLRETNGQRVRCLGRDRFWNQYWWFERNGMPYTGLPGSLAEERGYMNGRLWVHGPHAAEVEGFLTLPDAEEKVYKAQHGMSVLQRKAREEGSTTLSSAAEWGYYDNPTHLDELITWLDDRGIREKALKKELVETRGEISARMEACASYHASRSARLVAAEEESTRIATRHRLNVQALRARYPCLEWENRVARDLYGRALSHPAPPTAPATQNGRAKRKKAKKKAPTPSPELSELEDEEEEEPEPEPVKPKAKGKGGRKKKNPTPEPEPEPELSPPPKKMQTRRTRDSNARAPPSPPPAAMSTRRTRRQG